MLYIIYIIHVSQSHLINEIDLPDLPAGGGAGRLYSTMKTKPYKEPSYNNIFFNFTVRVPWTNSNGIWITGQNDSFS